MTVHARRIAMIGIIFLFSTACGSSSPKNQNTMPTEPSNPENPPPEVLSSYLGGSVIKQTEMTFPTPALTGDSLETGDTVACMDSASGKGTITRLEVFEYYEALELTQRKISLGDSSLDVWTRAASVAKRLENLDPSTHATTVAMIQLLKAGFRELPSAKLFGLPVTDTIVSLPQTCFLIQAAAVVGKLGNERISMYVDASIWQTMNPDQKTGLILHEALKLTHQVTFTLPTSGITQNPGSDVGVIAPLSGSSDSEFAGPANNPAMTHKSYRAFHMNLVDHEAGFAQLNRLQYINTVRSLGQQNYFFDRMGFDLSYGLSFHDETATKVKSGFSSRNYDNTVETTLFKPIHVSGHVVFYPSGKIKKLFAGSITTTSGGIPSTSSQYEEWELKSGGTGHVAGVVSFSEDGNLSELKFGFIPTTLTINLADAAISIPPPRGQIGTSTFSDLQSFSFVPGKPYSCSICTGSLTFPKRTVTFKDANIKPENNNTGIHSSYENRIQVTIPENAKIMAVHLILRADGGLVSLNPSSRLTLSCPNGQSDELNGYIDFNDKERIERVNSEPVICSDYIIRIIN